MIDRKRLALACASAFIVTACGGVRQVQEERRMALREDLRVATAHDSAPNSRFGRSVALENDIAVVGAPFSNERGSLSGAAFVFVRDPAAHEWVQAAKLLASDAAAGDQFGWSVSISGDTVIVGAVGDSDQGEFTGSAYIFSRQRRPIDAWREVRKLTARSPSANDHFGESVSIDGDTAVVGAQETDSGPARAGSAYVFERNQNGESAWGQVTRLTSSDGSAGDGFGFSVAVSGDTAVIGAPRDTSSALPLGGFGAGAVYVFTRNPGGAPGWREVVKRTASDAALQAAFGWTVALSGDIAAIGAPGADRDGTDAGAAYILSRNKGGIGRWNEVARLHPRDPADSVCCRAFGWSVSLSGDTAVIGAPQNDASGAGGPRPGVAYVFQRSKDARTAWRQVLMLTAPHEDSGDGFGRSVAVRGTRALSTASEWSDSAGAVYVFPWMR